MRTTIVLALLLVAGCATTPTPVEEARKHFDKGRGEEALALLQRTAKENPQDQAVRGEYFRLRALVVAQWLAQAETLRTSGHPDAAEALYRRVQQHDVANHRAAAGLEQLAADRRHREAVASAERLVREERWREAADVLRPVLAENPQQRDARRLHRVIDERLSKPPSAMTRLKASPKPVSLELRDVPLRSVFDLLGNAAGVTFVFDRDVRSDQRTSIVIRNASVEEAIHLVALANSLET